MASFIGKLTRTAVDEDGERVYIADATGDFSDLYYVEKEIPGQYIGKINETGYGTQTGVLKSTYARIVYAVYKDVQGDVLVMPENYNASDGTNDEFVFKLERDGIYFFYMLYVPYQEQTYIKDYIYFSPDGNKEPFAGDLIRRDGFNAIPLEQSELLGLAGPNVLQAQVYKDGFLSYALKAHQQGIKKMNDFRLGIHALNDQHMEFTLSHLEISMAGFLNAYALELFLEAQRIIEKNDELIRTIYEL